MYYSTWNGNIINYYKHVVFRLKTMSPQIKYKTNYVKILETACVKYDFPAPVYTVLSQTKNDFKLENYYSIQCEAMDFIAIGKIFIVYTRTGGLLNSYII